MAEERIPPSTTTYLDPVPLAVEGPNMVSTPASRQDVGTSASGPVFLLEGTPAVETTAARDAADGAAATPDAGVETLVAHDVGAGAAATPDVAGRAAATPDAACIGEPSGTARDTADRGIGRAGGGGGGRGRGRGIGRGTGRLDSVEKDTGPISGGPVDESLLPGFRKHIAHQIWKGKEREPIMLYNHYKSYLSENWSLDGECEAVQTLVRSIGLMVLVDYCYHHLDWLLIFAFLERFHSETNSFHMPWGEMTLTLHDVDVLLGLPITGPPVARDGSTINREEAIRLMSEGFGVNTDVVGAEMARAYNVRLKWIREQCRGSVDTDTDAKKACTTRAYILYMFGSTIFADKSSNRVSVYHMQNLMDLDCVKNLNWGNAILAYLYRNLGDGSLATNAGIRGCMTLLQAWICEHFMLGRATLDPAYVETTLRVRRWPATSQISKSKRHSTGLAAIREQLDYMPISKIVFESYGVQHPIKDAAYYSGCLMCYDLVESYYPDRVLREFGYVQTVPPAPAKDVHSKGKIQKEKNVIEHQITNWVNHILPQEKRGAVVTTAH